MDEKKYREDGYLIVSETDKCSLWEKDTVPCRSGYTKLCFFCKFASFRTPEYIRHVEESLQKEKLYSVCLNKKNRKKEYEKVDKNEK